jgi:hypothetical protein
MCYNSTNSFIFATIGFLTIIYINFYNLELKKTGIQYILLFYSLMELLQGIQYSYINQCSNILNIFLTEIAYVFVIVQPLIWNIFFYINSNNIEKKIFLTAICLIIFWMFINILSRIMYNKNNLQTKQNSVFASNKVCTKRKLSHLYWEWTSANFGDLNANFLTYLMLWFIPALITVKYFKVSLFLILSALVALFMSYLSGEIFVFTSLWCYISVPIVLIIIIILTNKKYFNFLF